MCVCVYAKVPVARLQACDSATEDWENDTMAIATTKLLQVIVGGGGESFVGCVLVRVAISAD